MDNVPSVFLIEDSQGDALLLQTAFRVSGLAAHFVVVLNGDDALARLQELARRDVAWHPDLIVLDLNLPRLSGLELLAYLGGEPRLHVPTIVLTTSANSRERCLEFGIAGYLVKPCNFNGYLEIAKELGQVLGIQRPVGEIQCTGLARIVH